MNTMKGIVKVNKRSAYAVYNGHTFDVNEVLGKTIALDINGTITDFTHKEVILVDFEKHKAAAYTDGMAHTDKGSLYRNLITYQMVHGIQNQTISAE